ASGRATATAAALAAALAFLLTLATLSALASYGMQWFLRERRRAEIATLLFLVFLSVVGMLPALISQGVDHRPGAHRPSFSPEEFDRELPAATRLLPSEMYGRALRLALDERPAASLAWPGGLAALGAALFALSGRLHRHLVESPEEGRTRRRGALRLQPSRFAGLSGPAGAVARVQVRTALRTLRGKFLLFFSGPIVALIGLTLR